MTPLFQVVIHTAARAVHKKEQAHPARKSSGIVGILFYGLVMVLVLLIVWLTNAFLSGQ